MANHIRRREFLAGSATAAAAVVASTAQAFPDEKGPAQEFYEWRTFVCDKPEQRDVVSKYVETALLPALGRQGIDRVGVFHEIEGSPSLHLLIPFKTLEQFGQHNAALANDKEYLTAASEYLAIPKNAATYSRIKSRFMKAFAGMPVIEQAEFSKKKSDRIFELRIYESHNEEAARRKVEMFNEGEIDIMRDVEMAPVFYGETLISDDVPNLTYMLSAENAEAHKAHWKAFLAHPEWDRMKKMKRYAGTVSKITSITLEPTAYSQL